MPESDRDSKEMLAAIIVLFRPDLALLERLLLSLNGQVDAVIVVDNTPGSSAAVAGVLAKFEYGSSYIPLGDNKGIAEAQNVGIRESIKRGYSHVLLLDQDSALPPGMVRKLLAAETELLKAGTRIAAVGPQYIDEKTGAPSFAVRYGAVTVRKISLDARSSVPVETDTLIASGSIIRTATLQSVGMMRGDLFIDFVDTEWALRARTKGYRSFCVPDAIMTHSVGDRVVNAFGKVLYIHSSLRTYYRVRNAAYLLQLHSMGWRWRSYTVRWIPCHVVLNLWISRSKLRNARLLLRAIWDGLSGNLGPASIVSAIPACKQR